MPTQNLGNHAFWPDKRHQVLLTEIASFHQSPEDFGRGSIWNGMMLLFVGFDQSNQNFGILLFFARWIFQACQLVQDRQVYLVLTFRSDRRRRADLECIFFRHSDHNLLHESSSYAAWARICRI